VQKRIKAGLACSGRSKNPTRRIENVGEHAARHFLLWVVSLWSVNLRRLKVHVVHCDQTVPRNNWITLVRYRVLYGRTNSLPIITLEIWPSSTLPSLH